MPVSKTINQVFLLILLAGFTGVVSCGTPKDIVYFQNISRDTTLQNTVSKNFDLKIKPDDLLYVGVTSASAEQSMLFNAPQVAAIGGTGTGGGTTSGYLVDKAGNIQLYKLGDVKVAGLTRTEVKDKLQRDLGPYLKEPVVTVRNLNNRITVLGEVGRPGVLPLQTDQITLTEALGQSGDLKITGKRDNILIIRQTENGKDFKRVNLLDNSVFSSPYYYLQNEDVVYVEPDLKRTSNQRNQVIQWIVSGTGLIVFLVDRLFFR